MYYTTARAVPTEYSPPMNIKLHLVVPSYYFFNLVCQFLEKKKKKKKKKATTGWTKINNYINVNSH